MASDVTGTAASWSYDPAGRPTGRVDTNGSGSTVRSTTIGYNPDDTLADYATSAGGSTLARDAYTYDDDGNILTHTVTGSAQALSNTYSYNPAGNLTGFSQDTGGASTATSYSFDHDANRLTSSTTGAHTTSSTWTYRADNAIKTAQTTGQPLSTFGYSAAGELTDDGCFTYSYDEFSRTRTSSLDSGAAASCGRAGTTTYTYDGLDRQQQATVAGSSANGTTHNSYDGLSTTLVGQTGALTGSGTSTPDVLYALNPDGSQVAYTQTGSGAGSGSVFLDQDGYGNITSLLNSGGSASACSVNYDPYGNPILGTTPPVNGNGVCASGSAAASTGNSIWYRGQARSFTTGSYQLGQRTYQPALGSFTTPDTYRVDTPDTDLSVGTDPLTANSYSYVNGNPVNFTDPDGHDPANHECDTTDMVQCHDYSYGGDTYSHGKANRVDLPDNFNVRAARACDWESACFETQPTKAAAGSAYNPAPGSLVPHPCDSPMCFWNDFKDLVGINAVESCISSHSVGSCVKAAVAVGAVACSAVSGGGCKVITAVVDKSGEAADFAVGTTGVEAADEGATAADLAGATCGGESFTPDTNVVMADGTTKPLDHVKVGDKVEATDPATGKTSAQPVVKVWVNHDTDLMDVTIAAGGKTSTVHATQHHLFWDVTSHAWVEADHLAAGDRLRTDSGTVATVSATVIAPGSADLWDLTVQISHDFYVVTTAANILVHNCPSSLGRGSTGRTAPSNLKEQLAMEQAQSNPGAGRVLTNITMSDSRWPVADGWVKMQQNVNGTVIHYVYNTRTGAVDDFKFK